MAAILKRLVMLMVFVVFIFSIAQVAVAEEGTSGEGSTSASTEVKSESSTKSSGKDTTVAIKTDAKVKIAAERGVIKDTRKMAVGEVKEVLKSNATVDLKKDAIKEIRADTKVAVKESKEKIKMIKEERKEKLQDIRELVKKEREVYREVKEKHKEVREDYHEERDGLKKKRDEAKGCKDADAGCKAKKDEVKKGVRMHLTKTVDLIESSLVRLQARVEASATLSAEEKIKALADLDALEVKLTAQREVVVALEAKGNVTNEELRTAVKDLKKTWEEVRKAQRRIIAEMMNAENEHAEKKHEEFGTSMQKKIDRLKASGADVSGLVALQAEFTTAQAKLEADRAAALAAWKAAENKEAAREDWKKAQAVVKEDLQKSKEILRKFLVLYKELAQKAGVKDDVAVSTSVAAEASTSASTSAETSATTSTSTNVDAGTSVSTDAATTNANAGTSTTTDTNVAASASS